MLHKVSACGVLYRHDSKCRRCPVEPHSSLLRPGYSPCSLKNYLLSGKGSCRSCTHLISEQTPAHVRPTNDTLGRQVTGIPTKRLGVSNCDRRPESPFHVEKYCRYLRLISAWVMFFQNPFFQSSRLLVNHALNHVGM